MFQEEEKLDNVCHFNKGAEKLCKTARWVYKFEFRFEDIKKVQVGRDQEKAQSEKDSHSKNQGGKKPN